MKFRVKQQNLNNNFPSMVLRPHAPRTIRLLVKMQLKGIWIKFFRVWMQKCTLKKKCQQLFYTLKFKNQQATVCHLITDGQKLQCYQDRKSITLLSGYNAPWTIEACIIINVINTEYIWKIYLTVRSLNFFLISFISKSRS